MEPGGRKILPRIRPSSAGQGPGDVEVAIEPARRREDGGGGGVISNGTDGKHIINLKNWRPMYEEEGPPRKRQHVVDSRAQSQVLPGVQQLPTVPTDPEQVEAQMSTPCRLVRNPQNGLYYSHGAFIFKSPSPPGYDFPRSIANDARPFSFATIEPDLMDVFKHAWYLRQYARSQRAHGRQIWWDHTMMNDSYGIDSTLHSWSSRYEPGTAQYPASMLYKNVLWLYFNRSIQPSISTTSFRDVVDDGLHHLQILDRGLGSTDRLFLLVPLFLLGTTSFETHQRQTVWRYLERIDPVYQTGSTSHAMHVLEIIWGMMDDHRVVDTWNWERLQDPASTQHVLDRSLVELLQDPWIPGHPPARVRSPEAMPEFDSSRFRAAPPLPPASVPPVPEGALNTRNSSGDTGRQTPSQGVSPTDASRPAAIREGSEHWADARQERTMSQPELAPAPPGQPRPFLAPPPPSSGMLANNELLSSLRAFTRKVPQVVKANKSSVPPCQVCGKELKNPSDAQKHQLQHSKPFVCKEPGCPRIQGFATENDLQRHRKSVHGASPRIGNKIGYICVECPDPSDGTPRKWWPRLDNFKAHIRRKHHGADEEALILRSTAPRRQGDTYADSGYIPGSENYTPTPTQYQTSTQERQHHQNSITSQTSDVNERDSEQATQEDHTRQSQQRQGADEDGEEAEGEGEEEEEADDRPVGPWELHRSFRENRRKRALEEDDGNGEVADAEDAEEAGRGEDESPLSAASKQEEVATAAASETSTPQNVVVDAEADRMRLLHEVEDEKDGEKAMDVNGKEEEKKKKE